MPGTSASHNIKGLKSLDVSLLWLTSLYLVCGGGRCWIVLQENAGEAVSVHDRLSLHTFLDSFWWDPMLGRPPPLPPPSLIFLKECQGWTYKLPAAKQGLE